MRIQIIRIYRRTNCCQVLKNIAGNQTLEFIEQRRVALAKKEVIISAGSLNSPKLLMLSGVGPKQHLRDMGVRKSK